LATPQQST